MTVEPQPRHRWAVLVSPFGCFTRYILDKRQSGLIAGLDMLVAGDKSVPLQGIDLA
jgi:hypothetical protein